jgi:hypothetical protein
MNLAGFYRGWTTLRNVTIQYRFLLYYLPLAYNSINAPVTVQRLLVAETRATDRIGRNISR